MRSMSVFASVALALLTVLPVVAADGKSLFRKRGGAYGWELNEGKEYPGAKGILAPDKKASYRGVAPLRLRGDFTEGGGYVAAEIEPPRLEASALEMMIRVDTQPRLTVRFIDDSDQVHQYRYKLEATDEWQRLRLPLQDLFEDQDAHPGNSRVASAEHWGGADDKAWHGPAKKILIMLSKEHLAEGDQVGNLWIAAPRLVGVPARGETDPVVVALSDFASPLDLTWGFDNGREFAGATGSLTVETDGEDGNFMRLTGNFSAGGAYVQGIRRIALPEDARVSELRFQMRSKNVASWGIRLIDGSGQVHQHKREKLDDNGRWQEMVWTAADFVAAEHWGGKNDGEWHGGLTSISILLNKKSAGSDEEPVLDIRQVEIELAR